MNDEKRIAGDYLMACYLRDLRKALRTESPKELEKVLNVYSYSVIGPEGYRAYCMASSFTRKMTIYMCILDDTGFSPEEKAEARKKLDKLREESKRAQAEAEKQE